MLILRFVFLFLLLSFSLFSQIHKRPKIGLVLSGGGAKGLAHVGILEVLDDIGLKVDYITGTSMGSIIGALYATGYSGDSIHKIATAEKWDDLLRNQVPLEYIPAEEKAEYGQYNIELGFEDKRFRMPTGLLDGHLLALELTKLTSPVSNRKKFTDFPIPFKCVATNIETGNVAVLDSGNIVDALRASMAIPSFFTPVEYNGQYYVDGGVLRNFPVTDAKEMGADIIIGVNVSSGILPAKKLSSIPSVLFQSISLAGNTDFQRQVKEVDYLIEPSLSNFSVADFSKADSIVVYGRIKAETFRKKLTALKDSLDKLYPKQYTRTVNLPTCKIYHFCEVQVVGLKRHTASYVTGSLQLKSDDGEISCTEIEKGINRLMGTQNFRKISYEFLPGKDSTQNKLVIYVIESSKYSAKVDANYNTFFKASLILKLTARNCFLPNSKLTANLNIGDNIRIRTNYGKSFGVRRMSQLNLYGNFDQYDIPTTITNGNSLLYSRLDKMNLYAFGLEMQQRVMGSTIYTGIINEYFHLKNIVNSSGKANFIHSNNFALYAALRYNSLNGINYPTKGWRLYASASYVFDYRYRIVDHDGNNSDIELPDLSLTRDDIQNNFQQAFLSASHYNPLLGKTTLVNSVYAGLTFNTRLTFSHFYRLGGLRENFQGNIPFVGIREFSHRQSAFLMNNVVSYQVGIQQETFRMMYVIPRVSVAATAMEFNKLSIQTEDASAFLLGYGLTLAYSSPIGPLEFTVMKSNQFRDPMIYVNLGFHFFNR